MINMPLAQIKEKIITKAGLSESDVNAKIKDKLRQLSGLISEEGAAHIVANELGVKLFEVGEKLQVKNVLSGMRNVDLAAKVIQKYDLREFASARGPGKVLSMLVGDETGLIRVVLWNKQAENASLINEGDIIKVVGGYVRENQGRNEVHLNDLAKLIINPTGISIDVKPRAEAREFVRKKISEITENDANLEVLATIVQVFDLNFFEVCPQCSKRVRLREEGFACQTHNIVTPDFNYVLNVYLDDGSDNVRVVLWREQIEQLLGMQKPQVMMFKEDPTMFESVKNDLLGNMIIVSGRASRNQTFDRIEVVASKVNKNPDPRAETEKLKEHAASMPEKPAAPAVAAKPTNYMQSKPQAPARNPDPDAEEGFTSMNIEDELVDIDDL